MGLSKGVAASNEGHCLLVVHRHPTEGLADVPRRGQRIRLAIRAFRVDVDQSHLHRRQRVLQLPVAAVALIGQPLLLRTPVDNVRNPLVDAAAGEPVGLEAHRLERDVAGQHHQVSPGELLPVLLLDWPEQPTRLVEVGVVRPAVERLEAQLAPASSPTAIRHPVGPGAVPGHADEERSVIAVIGWPPRLRGRQDLLDIRLDRFQIERRERLRVIEILAHWAHRVGRRRVLPQRTQIQLLRPPVLVVLRLPLCLCADLLGTSPRHQDHRRDREDRLPSLHIFHQLLLTSLSIERVFDRLSVPERGSQGPTPSVFLSCRFNQATKQNWTAAGNQHTVHEW